MKLKVYRSLDRPAAFFGIKGRYQSLALYAFATDLAVSFLLARATNGLLGVMAFILLGGLIYVGTLYLQDRNSERALTRLLASRHLPGFIKTRPMRISSLLKQSE